MPYIAVKMWPKDPEVKKKFAENLIKATVEAVGCPPQAVTVSMEEIDPSDWEEKVVKGEIESNKDRLTIIKGA